MRGGRLLRAFDRWGDLWIRGGWRVQTHCLTADARVLAPDGRLVASGSGQECLAIARQAAPRSTARRGVVLLHGLGHHPGATAQLARALEAAGWAVANTGYPSLRSSLEAHAAAASAVAAALAEDGAERISWVGHSLGGLVARAALARAPLDGWTPGRLVLVGSPARGSGIAHLLRNSRVYQRATGACGQAVTPAGAASVPLPKCRAVGIIAGGNGGRGYNPLLAGDNDGVVTVAETRLPGHEAGFLRVPSLHTPLAGRPETVLAATRFLDGYPLAT